VRSESGTYFTPRHSVRMLGRTLWNSACRWAHPRAPRRRRAAALRRRARADARRACSFCRRSAKAHTAEGRCQSFDDEVSKIMCVAASADGALLAWGTDTGMLSVVAVDTGDQLALWKGHYGPVYSINFSPNHKSLVSCGRDLNPTMPPDQVRAPRCPASALRAAHARNPTQVVQLSPEEMDALPRKHSVVRWDLEQWIKRRLKAK